LNPLIPSTGTALLALALLQPAAPPLDVTVGADGVHLMARNVPLARVLEELSHRGGWQLVFLEARPNDPVTVSFEAATAEQALFRLFDGLRVSYAVAFDAEGRHIQQLIVGGPSGAPARGGASRPVAAQPAEPPEEEPEEPYDEEPAGPGDLPPNVPQLLPVPGDEGAPPEAEPTFQPPASGPPAGVRPAPGATPIAPPWFRPTASYPQRR
jgi:hypothetical protein